MNGSVRKRLGLGIPRALAAVIALALALTVGRTAAARPPADSGVANALRLVPSGVTARIETRGVHVGRILGLSGDSVVVDEADDSRHVGPPP